MLLHDAALSYLHFVFVLILAGALAAEAFVLRLPVDGRVARLLLRIDLFYGIASFGVIVAGISRVLWGAKGAEYYTDQWTFWAKMGVFLLIGILSSIPTRRFMRWAKSVRANANFMPDEVDVRNVRRVVMVELHLLACVPVFAALMARAIGS